MYLSELEIVGFKSFGQKTVLKFADGITAIVGPNGCGKSNIVDAIRWVLGEQKTAVLRSDVMENVIFNGNSKRKPLGMSEVIMRIQNNKNVLPTEYNEVSITRRLFRNGESNYLLNNTKCRLKDIQDLFMDTGLGPDSYSVIELKMISTIISGKMEERRHLLEEAAGVTKYKQRRKETNRKLESVQSDLNRLNDILEEVKKNVASLARQASKTKRYHALIDEMRLSELNLLQHEAFYYINDKRSIESELGHLTSIRQNENEKLEEYEQQSILQKEKINILNTDYIKLRDDEKEMNNTISDTSRQLAVSEEKLKSNSVNLERLKNEIAFTSEELKQVKIEIENTKSEIDIANNAKAEALEFLNSTKQKLDEKIKALNEYKREIDSLNSSYLNEKNNVNTFRALLKRDEEKKIHISRRLDNSKQEVERLNNNIVELTSQLADATLALENEEKRREELDTLIKVNNEKRDILNETLRQKREELNGVNSNISSLNATLNFLKNISDSDTTTQFLFKDKSWKVSSDTSILAEAFDTDEMYKFAILTLLGEAARYIIVDNANEAESAINLLVKSNKGQATFLNLDNNLNLKVNSAKHESFIDFTHNLIKADEKILNFMKSYFGDAVIVENDDKAKQAIEIDGINKAVTLQGKLYHKNGLIKGGSSNKNESALLGKNIKIKELQTQIEELLLSQDKINQETSKLKESFNLLDNTNNISQLRQTETKLKDLNQKIANFQIGVTSANSKIEISEQTKKSLKAELEVIDNEEKDINLKITTHQKSENVLRTQLDEFKIELHAKEQDVNNSRQEFTKQEIEFVRKESDLKNAINTLNQKENKIKQDEIKLAIKQKEIITINENNEDLEGVIKELRANLDKLKRDLDVLLNQRDKISTNLEQIKNQSDSMNQEFAQLRKTHEKTSEKIHQLEVKNGQIAILLENIENRMTESHHQELNLNEFQPTENFNVAEEKAKVDDFKQKLANLGNVNFAALEEFDVQSERLNFTQKQVNDLVDSEKTLLEAIEEINRTAEAMFVETFDKIKSNFTQLFKTLFNEHADAELNLGEGNPLEADIIIRAVPPGKKPKLIEQLSEGEKTLTAISLLFAIYLVKPSPICILDEVDAPLDDTNTGNFLKLVKQFSNNTQFLIVTHNKKSMEAADHLYGVTMQEEGLSKLVSVRLNGKEDETTGTVA